MDECSAISSNHLRSSDLFRSEIIEFNRSTNLDDCRFRVCLEEIVVNKWAMKNAESPRGQRDQCPPLPLPSCYQSSFFFLLNLLSAGTTMEEREQKSENLRRPRLKGWVWESSLNWWGLLRADQDHGTEADRPMTLLLTFVGARKKTQRQKSNDLLWLLFLL